MSSLLIAALLSAAPCPALPTTTLVGRVSDAALDGCSVVLVTELGLTRLDPRGVVERSLSARLTAAKLAVDPKRGRLFVMTVVHGDDGLAVTIARRKLTTLEPDGADVKFLAPRKVVVPRASTGGRVAMQVRPDGSLAVVTRVDSVPEPRTAVLTSWTVSPEGEVSAQPLGELPGPEVGGELVFVLAPDGRGLVGVSHNGVGPDNTGAGAQLYGLTRTGALDPSFGERGHAVDPNISFPIAAAARGDTWVFTGTHARAYRVVVTRYLRDGRVDERYATKGRVVLKAEAIEHPRDLVIDSHDDTLVAGTRFWRKEGRSRPTLITLDADGKRVTVKELDFGSAARVEVVRLFAMQDRSPRFAGHLGADALDREATSFWRQLDFVASAPEPTEPTEPSDAAPQLYRWVDRDGVEGFATSLDEVPPQFRAIARPWSPR